MRGSLEAPPIMIRRAGWWAEPCLAGVLLACGYLAWRMGWYWDDLGDPSVTIPIACAALALLLLDVVRPRRLVIDRRGVRQSRLLGVRRWGWDELGDFRVLQTPMGRRVGFDYSVGRGDRALESQAAPLGADACLPGGWELEPQRLADLLNRAHERWSEASPL